MSVLWRESPEDAWRRETRRVGSRRARAAVAAVLAYALSLMVMLELLGALRRWDELVAAIGLCTCALIAYRLACKLPVRAPEDPVRVFVVRVLGSVVVFFGLLWALRVGYEFRALRSIGGCSVLFLMFLWVFGVPTLVARSAYMRALPTSLTSDAAHPPHRPQTF